MAKRPALGKGIGALLTSASQDGRHKYFVCPVEELKPHHQQPRKTFNDAKMAELVASIREKGVIQPLVVRHTDDHYQIIAGERRWRAAQKAGLKEVPVVIQDLNPIEEAEAYRHLMSNFDLSQEEVARRVGRERPTVANALRLLRLPREIQQDVIDGQLSMGHARALLSLDGAARIKEARDQVVRKQFSVRQTEALVKKLKGSTGQPTARKTRIDPELADLAARLQRCLGTKVNILPQTRGGKGGKIEISYYSAEEFERLLELFERR